MFKRVIDFLRLVALNLLVGGRDFVEYLRVIKRYYRNRSFRRVDLKLIWVYLLRNPFRICRQFLQSQGVADVYAYGETPLTTVERIADECELSANDIVFELGCGRGRSCFWLHCIRGCKVVGVDFVPTFIRVATYLQEDQGLDGVSFIEGDIAQMDYASASVVYLYGTGFDRPLLASVAEAFERLPVGAKVVTVSYSMNDYSAVQQFKVLKIFPVRFNWGESLAYLQEKVTS